MHVLFRLPVLWGGGAASFDPRVHLSLADVCVDSHVNPSFVEINIQASKTDPFCQGVKVCHGTTAKDLCPVGASYTTWP